MRFIRFSQLKEKGITFTRQHVGRLQKAGKFPRSVPLGENTKPFIEEEIDKYLLPIIIVIVLVSVAPPAIHLWRERQKEKKEAVVPEAAEPSA